MPPPMLGQGMPTTRSTPDLKAAAAAAALIDKTTEASKAKHMMPRRSVDDHGDQVQLERGNEAFL